MTRWPLCFMPLLLIASTAAAMPLYRIERPTVACDAPTKDDNQRTYEAALAFRAGRQPPSGCRILPRGYRFEAMNRSEAYVPRGARIGMSQIYGRPLWKNGKREDWYFLVPGDDATPVLDAHGQFIEAPCSEAGVGGEVDRLEADRNGRVFLRRYEITTVCVNGVVRQHVRRLN